MGDHRTLTTTSSATAEACPPPPLPTPTLCGACQSHLDSHSPSTSNGPSPPPTYRPIRAPSLCIPNREATQKAIILSPVPHPQSVPTISIPHSFFSPNKRIASPADIDHFLSTSPHGSNFLGFVAALSHSVLRKKVSDPLPVPLSKTLVDIQSILHDLSSWIEEIPPVLHQARYGNPAYRQWHQRLADEAEGLILQLLPEALKPASVELLSYFLDSFGNSSRIDYGTGHETNFAAFLYCLTRLGLLDEENYQGLVLRVFVKYLDLMRKLQTVYCLEPAGSHGVWGLDDYHFLPFIFGSAQLVDHKYMKPKSIHNQDILDNFSSEYMYLGCVAFVRKVKKGLFVEHSPLLDDISGVQKWSKINSAMLKMYKAEVLEKVPIM